MSAPNFLENFIYRQKKPISCVASVTILFLALIFVTLSIISPLFAFLILIVFLITAIAVRLEWGVYLLAAVAFFQGWEIDFFYYAWTRDFPFLSSLNAPIVDFVVVMVCVSFLLALVLRLYHLSIKKWSDLFPGGLPYGLFLLTALGSVFFSGNISVNSGLYVWLRLLVFVYVMFIFLPYHAIRTKKIFEHVIQIWFVVSLGIALYGISSLFMNTGVDWLRVTPYAIGSFAPLGYNHNLLAEPLIVIIPLGIWLSMAAKPLYRFWYALGVFLMTIVALLTLSRAAWVALCAQAVLFVWMNRKKAAHLLSRLKIEWVLLSVALFLPIVVYMGLFLTSSTVSSSTFSRIEATKVVLALFQERPLFGYGPGTFISLLDDVELYVREFGEALDAHGFVQKIMVEEGALGLVFFLWFLVWVLWTLYRTGRQTWQGQMIFLMILGAVTFQLFNTSYFHSVMWLPMGIALYAYRSHYSNT